MAWWNTFYGNFISGTPDPVEVCAAAKVYKATYMPNLDSAIIYVSLDTYIVEYILREYIVTYQDPNIYKVKCIPLN